MSKRAAAALGAVAALAVLGTVLVGTGGRLGDVTLLLAHTAALVLAAVGVRRHRPALPHVGPVVLLTAAAGLATSLAVVVTDGDPRVVHWAGLSLHVVVLALVPSLVRTLRGVGPRITWPDLLLTSCGGCLVVVEVLGMLWETSLRHQPVVLAAAVAHIVIAIVVLRVLATRVGTAPATVLLLLASSTLLATATGVTVRGSRPAPDVHVLEGGLFLVALLLATAAGHPSMRSFGHPVAGGHLRSEGQRLLSVLPVFCAIPLLWVLSLVGVLPHVAVGVVAPSGYALACAGVALAALAVRRAERSADRDPLTELVNRRGLPRATSELRQRLRGQDLHLCLVDLDDFKQINDTRGHAVGDALLVEVAGRLRQAVGVHGVVSRTGGDEFIVVVWTPPEDEEGPADLLLAALDHPLELGGLPYEVSASIGIAPLRTGMTLDDVLVDADIAMYAAKQAGKGRAQVYRRELRERVLGGLARQRELRRLLQGESAEDVGELVVVHQPIVEIGSGPPRIVGVEALVRWHHPREGLLMPDDFLPHAEAAGLGARLDEHVAVQALADLAEWDRQGLPELHVALNLGVGSLHRQAMGRWIARLAVRHDIRPDRVHLEITEHEELPDDPRIAESLREVVAAGFRVDLDDFGIGYTSLSYMRRFPVSTVKLDRSLTALVTSGDISLLEGIVALCRAMDLRILAEGVENDDQLEPLRALGVQFAQGHWFGSAMPAEDVPGFARRIDGSGDGGRRTGASRAGERGGRAEATTPLGG